MSKTFELPTSRLFLKSYPPLYHIVHVRLLSNFHFLSPELGCGRVYFFTLYHYHIVHNMHEYLAFKVMYVNVVHLNFSSFFSIKEQCKLGDTNNWISHLYKHVKCLLKDGLKESLGSIWMFFCEHFKENEMHILLFPCEQFSPTSYRPMKFSIVSTYKAN